MSRTLRILGTRGIPAAHGGFETFAQQLSLYLVKNGWDVTVYCQEEGAGDIYEDNWNGIKRVVIPEKNKSALGTIIFDWKSTWHAAKSKDLVLTLGYNTAIFCLLYRLKGVPNIINMDGIEWRRQKWSQLAKVWFWFNDWAGCFLGNHLVADHPEIKNHLSTRVSADKVTMIPYGADNILTADENNLSKYGLKSKEYAIVIARAEPENSILEIVKAWTAKKRPIKLVILGKYNNVYPYHNLVKQSANEDVVFLGAIYDQISLEALRYHALFYLHGHQVGGTNPSLVEAMGAGNAVLAHSNKFNKWVAGSSAVYFDGEVDCANKIDALLDRKADLNQMREGIKEQYHQNFIWDKVLSSYEKLLESYCCKDKFTEQTNASVHVGKTY